jgi:hypothetical protein
MSSAARRAGVPFHRARAEVSQWCACRGESGQRRSARNGLKHACAWNAEAGHRPRPRRRWREASAQPSPNEPEAGGNPNEPKPNSNWNKPELRQNPNEPKPVESRPIPGALPSKRTQGGPWMRTGRISAAWSTRAKRRSADAASCDDGGPVTPVMSTTSHLVHDTRPKRGFFASAGPDSRSSAFCLEENSRKSGRRGQPLAHERK